MSKTNDEIIWEFHKKAVDMGGDEFNLFCKTLTIQNPNNAVVQNFIKRTVDKRQKVADYIGKF